MLNPAMASAFVSKTGADAFQKLEKPGHVDIEHRRLEKRQSFTEKILAHLGADTFHQKVEKLDHVDTDSRLQRRRSFTEKGTRHTELEASRTPRSAQSPEEDAPNPIGEGARAMPQAFPQRIQETRAYRGGATPCSCAEAHCQDVEAIGPTSTPSPAAQRSNHSEEDDPVAAHGFPPVAA